jgi:hypothetical protein
MGVVETLRVCSDGLPVADDGFPSLELLKGDIDACLPQGEEGVLKALCPDHPLEVAQFTMRKPQQGKIWASRITENAPFH